MAVKDFLLAAWASEEHLDLATGSPELIRRAMVHPDRTDLPGKHLHKAVGRRSAPTAGVDAPEISLLRALIR